MHVPHTISTPCVCFSIGKLPYVGPLACKFSHVVLFIFSLTASSHFLWFPIAHLPTTLEIRITLLRSPWTAHRPRHRLLVTKVSLLFLFFPHGDLSLSRPWPMAPCAPCSLARGLCSGRRQHVLGATARRPGARRGGAATRCPARWRGDPVPWRGLPALPARPRRMQPWRGVRPTRLLEQPVVGCCARSLGRCARFLGCCVHPPVAVRAARIPFAAARVRCGPAAAIAARGLHDGARHGNTQLPRRGLRTPCAATQRSSSAVWRAASLRPAWQLTATAACVAPA
jgi:hypothetical protein